MSKKYAVIILIGTMLLLAMGCSSSMVKCDSCGKELHTSKIADFGGIYLCPDCAVDMINSCDFGYCDSCGELIMAQDWLWELDGRPLCGECAYKIASK